MGEVAVKKTFYSVEEYLEMELHAPYKSEYHEGEIYAMADGIPAHSLISKNVGASLRDALRKRRKPCLSYNSDLQLAISETKYLYADASVICGKTEHYDKNSVAAKNPVLIVEVISPESATYDRVDKFEKYRQIDTFCEYVLIAQHRPFVEVFFKPENSSFWQYTPYQSLSDTIVLNSIEVSLGLEDLYFGVVFPPLPQD